MKNALILVVLILSVFSINKANSAILLEPYLGGHFFSSDVSNDEISGMAYGARVGWQQLGLMLGANYKTGSFENKDTNGGDIDSSTSMGAFIGYNFPIMIRVWAEYVFSSKLEGENGGEIDKGSGTTFGFGYTGLPFVSINLEMSKLDGYENSNGTDNSTELNTTFLSVSFPFTF